MDANALKNVAVVLTNDETSSDPELAGYFIGEFKMARTEALWYVSQRNRALSDPLHFKLNPFPYAAPVTFQDYYGMEIPQWALDMGFSDWSWHGDLAAIMKWDRYTGVGAENGVSLWVGFKIDTEYFKDAAPMPRFTVTVEIGHCSTTYLETDDEDEVKRFLKEPSPAFREALAEVRAAEGYDGVASLLKDAKEIQEAYWRKLDELAVQMRFAFDDDTIHLTRTKGAALPALNELIELYKKG